jgi:hypothetical protein
MPVPVIAASFAGAILSALVTFFLTKIPSILAALGLSVVMYSGLSILTDEFISGISSAVAGGSNITFEGHIINAVGILGAAGVFDAVNIILSGYVAVAAIKTSRVVLKAIAK